ATSKLAGQASGLWSIVRQPVFRNQADASSRLYTSPRPGVSRNSAAMRAAKTGSVCVALYRVPEIVTLGRLPGEGESDSRWRTKEVRHVGSDTLTPGF